jgi:hypothetical protein
MRAARSIVGALLAALYAMAFAALYLDYLQHAGQWFADFKLILISLPFVLTMRFVNGGSFDLTGEDTLRLLGAALFGCVLAYILGALLQAVVRALVHLARGRPAS